LAQFRSRTALFESIGHWTSHSCRAGFFDTCFIMRCCTQSCPTKYSHKVAGGFTRKNLTVASANSQVIDALGAGKKRICRVFCAKTSSARLGDGRRRRPLRRRGRRRYVLFDQVPERCREQERDQLRAPVFQNQSLHICCAIKSPRSVDEKSPE
jgi:hypothetical protein